VKAMAVDPRATRTWVTGIRSAAGIDGGVDQCSGAYGAGEVLVAWPSAWPLAMPIWVEV